MWDGPPVEIMLAMELPAMSVFRQLSVGNNTASQAPQRSHMNVGDKVENFTLQNQDGNDPRPGV
jgi:hypothetical protein